MGTDIHGVFQAKVQSKWEDIESEYRGNRHYQLFAVLAGVRNGFGFAGVPTGEAVTPIRHPRGFPEDFKINDFDEHNGFWMGEHHQSWLTAEEILSWSPPTVFKTGYISRYDYEKWDAKGSPESWSGGISGGGVVCIEDNSISKKLTPNWTHIRVEWRKDLKDELSYFFEEVKRLFNLHGEVRFVFGFDS